MSLMTTDQPETDHCVHLPDILNVSVATMLTMSLCPLVNLSCITLYVPLLYSVCMNLQHSGNCGGTK